jgi:hypothetical protein
MGSLSPQHSPPQPPSSLELWFFEVLRLGVLLLLLLCLLFWLLLLL